jgi:hypothetical protein
MKTLNKLIKFLTSRTTFLVLAITLNLVVSYYAFNRVKEVEDIYFEEKLTDANEKIKLMSQNMDLEREVYYLTDDFEREKEILKDHQERPLYKRIQPLGPTKLKLVELILSIQSISTLLLIIQYIIMNWNPSSQPIQTDLM